MKLWIRTQDKKKLLEAENVWVDSKTYSAVNNYNTIGIYEETKHYIMVDNNVVATYKNMDRCLTILDEIQKLLVGKVIIENKVMPKEKQSKIDIKENPIVTTPTVDIKTLNQNCVVYELPQE